MTSATTSPCPKGTNCPITIWEPPLYFVVAYLSLHDKQAHTPAGLCDPRQLPSTWLSLITKRQEFWTERIMHLLKAFTNFLHADPTQRAQVPTPSQLHNWFASTHKSTRSYAKSAINGKPRAAACEATWKGWFDDHRALRYMGTLVKAWENAQNTGDLSGLEMHRQQAAATEPGSESGTDSGDEPTQMSDDDAAMLDGIHADPPLGHGPHALAGAHAVEGGDVGNAYGDLQTALEKVKAAVYATIGNRLSQSIGELCAGTHEGERGRHLQNH